MEGVLSGLSVMWIVIGVGMLLGRFRVLGEHGQTVLTRFVYWVASPALLFSILSVTDVRSVLGPALGVEAVSAVLTAITFALVSIFVLRRGRVDTAVGAMTASLSNAAYIGIPLATYILGSATHVIPVMMFQLGLLTPTFFVITDLAAGRHRPTVAGTVKLIVTNPMLVAAFLGMASSFTGIHPPGVVFDSIEVLAGAAVPCILVSFGISLLESGVGGFRLQAVPIVVATAMKLLLQPTFAYLAARFLFGLDGFELFAATAMGGLPTAQNAYVAAFRAGAGNEIARGTVILSTVFVTPTMLAIAALLS